MTFLRSKASVIVFPDMGYGSGDESPQLIRMILPTNRGRCNWAIRIASKGPRGAP